MQQRSGCYSTVLNLKPVTVQHNKQSISRFIHPAVPEMMNELSMSPIWRLLPKQNNFIVMLKNGDDASIPFYCVHAITGDVTDYYELVRVVGANRRFYGIQVPASKLDGILGETIESLANRYVGILTDFQPSGPFFIGGYSAGAAVALEMARQLDMCGREVRLLVILDGIMANTGCDPYYYVKLVRNLPRWFANDLIVPHWFSEGLAKNAGFRILADAFVRRVRGKIVGWRKSWVARIRGRKIVPPDLVDVMDTSRWPKTQVSFARFVHNAVQAYVPKRYDGRVLIYATKMAPLHHLSKTEALWPKISDKAKIIYVNGNHGTMLKEPHVIELAADLTERLRDAEQRRR
jgi:thioesterase domain-containing protein